jgi:Fic-DOC domain mobile mystery protein B
MFGETWQWAGTFRTTNKNIGVDWHQISVKLKMLLDDVVFQITNGVYSADEIAVRFHHRLVWIHPFPNGNGRHARLASDLLIQQLGRPRFTWGRSSLSKATTVRTRYIEALQALDAKNVGLLLEFARA